MTTRLEQLHQQILDLDTVEREKLAAALPDEFFHSRVSESQPPPLETSDFPSIVATPGVCGGSATLIRTRIPVWTIERYRQLGASEAEILANFPSLQAVDIAQAWSYAARHRAEIEAEIRQNEEA